jgi:hypothetical protein
VFFYLLRELCAAMWEHLEHPEAPVRLYQFFSRYFSLGLEAFLVLNRRVEYLVLRTTLEALAVVLGEPEKGLPPCPEIYQQHRHRFLRLLAKTLPLPAGAEELPPSLREVASSVLVPRALRIPGVVQREPH